MAWRIEWDEQALKELRKLGASAARDVIDYLRKRIAVADSPRRFGKALTSDKKGLWRYRVGDYRIVCRIEDEALVVLVVRIGHRSKVYDK
ncbi:MAG: type II toxin-antitoxin system RelE family toxin [Holosporales bacterium]